MTYKGRVENGMIRLPDGELPEGASVTIALIEPQEAGRTVGDVMNKWRFVEGYPGESERMKQLLAEDREASIEVESEREKARP